MSEEREELIKALETFDASSASYNRLRGFYYNASKEHGDVSAFVMRDDIGVCLNLMATMHDALLLAHQETSVPEGWKLVLVEPTEAMENMGVAQLRHTREAGGGFGYSMMAAYRAMLNASPSPPTSQETT